MKADETDVKVDGKDVLFDRPVSFYIDNFLSFPVGSAVPVGYYDRAKAVWEINGVSVVDFLFREVRRGQRP